MKTKEELFLELMIYQGLIVAQVKRMEFLKSVRGDAVPLVSLLHALTTQHPEIMQQIRELQQSKGMTLVGALHHLQQELMPRQLNELWTHMQELESQLRLEHAAEQTVPQDEPASGVTDGTEESSPAQGLDARMPLPEALEYLQHRLVPQPLADTGQPPHEEMVQLELTETEKAEEEEEKEEDSSAESHAGSSRKDGNGDRDADGGNGSGSAAKDQQGGNGNPGFNENSDANADSESQGDSQANHADANESTENLETVIYAGAAYAGALNSALDILSLHKPQLLLAAHAPEYSPLIIGTTAYPMEYMA